ncbi:hypothetical protein Tco_1254135 [Tanacetum coccineum]
MANPLPPSHNADFRKVEPIQPEPAQDMPDPDEDVPLDKSEDVPTENLKDDKEEELEEEEMDVDEDEEMDDPEIMHPYEEMGPLSRPLPDSDTEPKEAVAPVGRSTLQLLPHIRRFSSTLYVEEGSSSTAFSVNHRKVFAPGPLGKNVDALQYKVKSLAQQMKDRAKAEFSTLKRLNNRD